MLWKENGSNTYLPTPSKYTADIEDTDKDSYSSAINGALIDNPIAVGLLKLSMSWDFNTEEEAEDLIQKTYKNPLILDVKVPVIQRRIFRRSKIQNFQKESRNDRYRTEHKYHKNEV